MPKVIQVIQSENPRGKGIPPHDPYRAVLQYHTLAGDFIAESDPCSPMSMVQQAMIEYYIASNKREEYAAANLIHNISDICRFSEEERLPNAKDHRGPAKQSQSNTTEAATGFGSSHR